MIRVKVSSQSRSKNVHCLILKNRKASLHTIIKDIHSCAIVVILYTIVVILNIHIYQIVLNLDTIHHPPCRFERPRHIRIASINKVLFDRVLIDDSLSIEKGSKYFMHRHLISHLIN